MASPSRSGGVDNLSWIELRSEQVCIALSNEDGEFPYQTLHRWTAMGIVEAESFSRSSRTVATGPGTHRIYRYPKVLQLALAIELHAHNKHLDEVKSCLLNPPEGYLSWGDVLAAYRPTSDGGVFSAISVRGEGLDLIQDPVELMGSLALDVSSVHINLALLKENTDEGIRTALSTV